VGKRQNDVVCGFIMFFMYSSSKAMAQSVCGTAQSGLSALPATTFEL
jgi:hypothetical protein